MRVRDWQLVRLGLVLALGLGVAALAAHPPTAKITVQESSPIILATALENVQQDEQGARARVDQCSLNPRDYADDRPIGEKSKADSRKKKVVVCG